MVDQLPGDSSIQPSSSHNEKFISSEDLSPKDGKMPAVEEAGTTRRGHNVRRLSSAILESEALKWVKEFHRRATVYRSSGMSHRSSTASTSPTSQKAAAQIEKVKNSPIVIALKMLTLPLDPHLGSTLNASSNALLGEVRGTADFITPLSREELNNDTVSLVKEQLKKVNAFKAEIDDTLEKLKAQKSALEHSPLVLVSKSKIHQIEEQILHIEYNAKPHIEDALVRARDNLGLISLLTGNPLLNLLFYEETLSDLSKKINTSTAQCKSVIQNQELPNGKLLSKLENELHEIETLGLMFATKADEIIESAEASGMLLETDQKAISSIKNFKKSIDGFTEQARQNLNTMQRLTSSQPPTTETVTPEVSHPTHFATTLELPDRGSLDWNSVALLNTERSIAVEVNDHYVDYLIHGIQTSNTTAEVKELQKEANQCKEVLSNLNNTKENLELLERQFKQTELKIVEFTKQLPLLPEGSKERNLLSKQIEKTQQTRKDLAPKLEQARADAKLLQDAIAALDALYIFIDSKLNELKSAKRKTV